MPLRCRTQQSVCWRAMSQVLDKHDALACNVERNYVGFLQFSQKPMRWSDALPYGSLAGDVAVDARDFPVPATISQRSATLVSGTAHPAPAHQALAVAGRPGPSVTV